jgi:hypothetical protein
VEEFKKKLKEGYPKYQGLTEVELTSMVFTTKPSSGAFGMFACVRILSRASDTDHEPPVLKL